MEVVIALISLFIILFLIVFACVVFTNAIEHLGEKLNLSEGAVGSVLAAVGTALPETIVPLVAILGAYFTGANTERAGEIGIGAILGAPFMLGTLAFFVTGVAVLVFARSGRRGKDMPVNSALILRDLHFFGLSYFIAIAASFLPNHKLKLAVAVLMVVIYFVYVFLTVRTPNQGCEEVSELDELYFSKCLKSPESAMMFLVLLQVIVSLLGIIILAHFFVGQITSISEIFKINPLILSMIITPIATELPEKFNSVIWVRAKKDTLAMGNVTGAMVFQSCIPTAVGLALTPWVLNTDSIVNVVIAYLSVFVVYMSIVLNKGVLKAKALLFGGFFYLLFIAYVVHKMV